MTKRTRKTIGGAAQKAGPETGSELEGSAETARFTAVSAVGVPSPEQLQLEAEAEPNYRDLSSYAAVIGTLRDKGLSYREIAEWLSERGLEVNHNAVYRVYTNSLSEYDAHLESQRADEDAQAEAERNR